MAAISARDAVVQSVINAVLFPKTLVFHWSALCLGVAALLHAVGFERLWAAATAPARGYPYTSGCVALLLLWRLFAAARNRAPIAAARRAGLPVLITGCDSGFGLGVAKLLSRRGFAVFASCFTDAGVAHLEAWAKASGGGGGGDDDGGEGAAAVQLTALRVDVTKQAELEACVARVGAATGGRLFALVNNAGVNLGCMAEWTPMAMYRAVFDVNFFAMVALSKLCLPLLRKQQQQQQQQQQQGGSGSAVAAARIINVSSVLGVALVPALSAYVASKHAAEAFTGVLRAECLASGGVRVVGVNPGFFQTRIVQRGLAAVEAAWEEGAAEEARAAWGGEAFRDAFVRDARVMAGVGGRPQDVVATLAQAVGATRPRSRYWVGLDAKLFFRAMALAPDWVVDTVMALALKVSPMQL